MNSAYKGIESRGETSNRGLHFAWSREEHEQLHIYFTCRLRGLSCSLESYARYRRIFAIKPGSPKNYKAARQDRW